MINFESVIVDATDMRGRKLTDYPSASVVHDVVTAVISAAFNGDITLEDAVFHSVTNATYYNGGFVLVTGLGYFTYESLNPEIATIELDGTITRVASGLCTVLIKGPITLRIVLDLTTVVGASTTTYSNPVVGSLAEELINQIDSRINSTQSMNTNGVVFATQDHNTDTYVRNINLWCSDVDLTSISPWNSDSNNRKAGTLVTQRHILGAAHYQYPTGTTVRFVGTDNSVYDRVIVGTKRHPNYSPYFPDLTIYTLDSDLPVAITPTKLMPANFGNYAKQFSNNRIAAIGLDQQEKALIMDWRGDGGFWYPTDTDRLTFSEQIVGGDSGNPAFVINNGELVLITVWTFGGAGAGTQVADHITDINQMITDSDTNAGVSTGYTVTTADFSAFPTF